MTRAPWLLASLVLGLCLLAMVPAAQAQTSSRVQVENLTIAFGDQSAEPAVLTWVHPDNSSCYLVYEWDMGAAAWRQEGFTCSESFSDSSPLITEPVRYKVSTLTSSMTDENYGSVAFQGCEGSDYGRWDFDGNMESAGPVGGSLSGTPEYAEYTRGIQLGKALRHIQ